MQKPLITKVSNTIWTAINILVAVGTIVSAYGGMVNPNTTVIPAILAMTFRFWLLGSVILLVIDLFGNWRIALIPGLSLALCFGPIRSVFPINPFNEKITAENEAIAFKVVSYNVHAYDDINIDIEEKRSWKELPIEKAPGNDMFDYLINSDADFLFLQESITLKATKRLGISIAQQNKLDSIYPYKRTVGNEMILSKYPLDSVSIDNDPKNRRRLAAATTEIEGRKLLLVSVHLQSLMLNDDDKELFLEITEGEARHKMKAIKSQLLHKIAAASRIRANQAEYLRVKLDSIGIENVVLGGDFNDIADCYAMRTIEGNDFKSAFSEAGNGMLITFHDDRFYFHIDHILYRGDMKAVKFSKGNCPASDHYPVEATFLWNKK